MKQILTSLLIIVFLASCSLPRKASTTSSLTPRKQVITPPDTTLTASDIIERTLQSQTTFTTLNIPKFDLKVQFGQNTYILRGSLRIIRDSIISLSVQPMLGIEVARIDFTPDLFTIYDKMNHRFSETPYDAMYIGTGIPFDFNAVQSMLSGQFYSIPHRDNHSFTLAGTTDSTYILLGTDNLNKMNQYFEVSTRSFLLDISGLQRGKNQILPFFIKYSDWKTIKRKYKYPYFISIELDHNKFYFNAQANIEELVFDNEINITRINLERYQRVSFTSYFTEQQI